MASKIANDMRLDPRIRAALGAFDVGAGKDVATREEMIAEMNSAEAAATNKMIEALMESFDNEDVAPAAGLRTSVEEMASQPDGNTIKIRFVRPDNDARLPCVYYIH